MNISAKLKVSASKSATSPSCKPLCVIFQKMQYKEILTQNQVIEIIEFILSDSKNELYESYSEMEKEIIKFKHSKEFENYLSKAITNNVKNLTIGIYNPDSKGKFYISKIELNPKYCNGKTYRYRIDGWAIIFIDLKFSKNSNDIEFRVSVNSKKRAENWSETNPEFGNPELWNWKNVESIIRKIINKTKKLITKLSSCLEDMKPLGSPNTKTNRMHEEDELIITEHQNKSLKCEVKPVE